MDLLSINAKLHSAQTAYDIFGMLQGDDIDDKLSQLKSIYRNMAKLTHADLFTLNNEKQVAHEAFITLSKWYDLAVNEIKFGNYGKRPEVRIDTPKHNYIIFNILFSDEIADTFLGRDVKTGEDLYIKIVRNRKNNDLINNEINTLKKIQAHTGNLFKLISHHINPIIDVFEVEGKQAIVFKQIKNFVSLLEITQIYPNGINPKDMAWMFRRLLAAQGILHEIGLVYGNVFLPNFFICPEDHNGKLTNFIASVPTNSTVKIINKNYLDYYPYEILNSSKVSSSTDIYIAAKCMVKLLGGNVKTKELPSEIPKKVKGFLRACMIENMFYRPQNSLDVHEEFGHTLNEVWKRGFHPFSLKK